jgi:hypothetical protein
MKVGLHSSSAGKIAIPSRWKVAIHFALVLDVGRHRRVVVLMVPEDVGNHRDRRGNDRVEHRGGDAVEGVRRAPIRRAAIDGAAIGKIAELE